MPNPRVLVVDDDEGIRDFMFNALPLLGFDVRVAVVEQAREIVRTWRPDGVLIDIAMPGEDGTQFAAWLGVAYPLARIILYSAQPHMDAIAKLKRELGVDEIVLLHKPFELEDLEKVLEKL